MKTITHQITITKEHFDCAVAVKWDTKTCVLAQAVKDFTGEPVRFCGHGSVITFNKRILTSEETHDLVCKFDIAVRDNNKAKLSEIRESLPLTFTFEEDEK